MLFRSSLQPLGLYVADSIFIGDYLTTRGELPEKDLQMIEESGFVPALPPGMAVTPDYAPGITPAGVPADGPNFSASLQAHNP